jgi:hypothetical protein
MARTASCPSCGAPVTFRAAASILAVCEYCQTTLLNTEEGVENLGKMAALADDRSPLRLGAEGRYRRAHFTVVGRIQLKYAEGLWNEWFLLFDNLRTGWLSEAAGEYTLSFLAKPSVLSEMTTPTFAELKPGDIFTFDKSEWTVSNLERAECVAGEGELPFKVGGGYPAPVADLQSGTRRATLDYSEGEDQPPLLFIGETVDFGSLKWRNLREGAPIPAARSKTAAKALRCAHCGAPILIKHEGVLAAGCAQCGGVTDAETGKILSRLKEMRKIQPLIPLGKVGQLQGEKLEAIGFMQRSMTAEGERYAWREYLLARVDQPGYRWLVEYDGHWSLANTLDNAPSSLNAAHRRGVTKNLRFGEEDFKHFQHYQAVVEHVVGEFTWRVKVGETSELDDYVAPPKLLCREKTHKEISWSLAEYLPHTEIRKGFGVRNLPTPEGVYANQPSPWQERTKGAWWTSGLCALVALVLQVVFSLWGGATYLRENFTLTPDGEASLSAPFTLQQQNNVLRVDSSANALVNIDNTWLELNLALVNEQSGEARYGDTELSYYSGVDSDGAWSEDESKKRLIFRAVPSGTWRLMLEHVADAKVAAYRPYGGQPSLPLKISVHDHRAPLGNLFTLLVVFSFWPLFASWRLLNFENQRWRESDHPIFVDGNVDEDE